MAQFSFKASEVENRYDDEFAPMPTNWYPAKIEEDKVEPVSEGKGMALNSTFVICGNKFANRKVFHRFGLKHDSSEGFVNMGRSQLATVCDALGMEGFDDSRELWNKLMAIKVVEVPAVKNDDGTIKYKAKNEVKGWKPIDQLEALQATIPQKGESSSSSVATSIPDSFTDAFKAPEKAVEKAGAGSAMPEQPWEKEATSKPATTQDSAPAVVKSATAWEADGWKVHPKSPKHAFKDKEVKLISDLEVEYSTPDIPEAPDMPEVPDAPIDDASDATPPWANQQ